MAVETDRPGGVKSEDHGFGSGAVLGRTATGGALFRLTYWLALIGGVLLLVAVSITVVSVTGRHGFSRPVPGDYELVEIVCAVGIFLFFPFTHATSGNITAEFFTAGLPVRGRRVLDIAHDAIFMAVAALLVWRLGHGLADKYASGDMSMLIHIPLWWAYSFAVLSMGLLVLVCAWRIVEAVKAFRT